MGKEWLLEDETALEVRKQSDHVLATIRKQRKREQKAGPGYKPSNFIPSDKLPPAKFYLGKVPQAFRTALAGYATLKLQH